jgi:uncharacterized protein (TIGR03083 family)
MTTESDASRTAATTRAAELDYPRWMDAARVERERMHALLSGLSVEAWEAATDCEGWAVRDVVAHLVGAAESNASIRETVRQGWAARSAEVDGDLIDKVNEIQVRERRTVSPARLLTDLSEASARGIARRTGLPGWLRALVVPFGPPLGTKPIGYLFGRIYTRDSWMHRIDICRATGADLVVSADHDGTLVEDVVAEWAEAVDGPFDLRLTGPAGGRWSRGTDPANPGTPSGDETSAIELDAVEFVRTVSGRARGDGLLAIRVPF